MFSLYTVFVYLCFVETVSTPLNDSFRALGLGPFFYQTMPIRKLFFIVWVLFMLSPLAAWGQSVAFDLSPMRQNHPSSSINRKELVRRHNPQTHHVGSQQFLIGYGEKHMMVDATALQTFVADAQSPINIALNLADTTLLSNLTMELDRWTGKASSHFRYNGQNFHVESIYVMEEVQSHIQPTFQQPTVAIRITSDSIFSMTLRPEASAFQGKMQPARIISLKNHATFQIHDDQGAHWFAVSWRGKASLKKRNGQMLLTCKGEKVLVEGKKKREYALDIILKPIQGKPNDSFYNQTSIKPFTDFSLKNAAGIANYWTECGIADFSATTAPEARQVEGRMVETLYRYCTDTPTDWWLQTPLTLYGFAKQIVPSLSKSNRNQHLEVWRHPEVIASALLTLRAYTLPEVGNRFGITEAKREKLYATVYNALAQIVAEAGDYLETEQPDVPECLSRDQLLTTARLWREPADSLSLFATVKGNDASAADSLSSERMFRLPQVSPTLPDHLLLLAIAGGRWPETWKVRTENILPVP